MEYNGERIRISRMTQDDLEFICEIDCNPNIWFFEEYIESDKSVLKTKYTEKLNSKSSYDFIINIIESGNPIGIAQIWSYVGHRRSWEIGFGLLPEHQGKGYGHEATKLLIDFAFQVLQAHKVVGMCNGKNDKSIQLMESVGMRREGIFKEELFWQDQWCDQYFYSILENEHKQL